MSATISENYLSRKFELGTQVGRELIYDIVGATPGPSDEDEVKNLLIANAPTVYQGLVLDGVRAEPEGHGKWKGYAQYLNFDDAEYTFETGGGTQHITQSLQTINTYAAPGFTAPDFGGAIGVSDDQVEGVDITSRVYQFTETHRFADGVVNAGFKATLFALTGRFNNASFKGLDAGECLFLGATGSKRGNEKWVITYRFAGSPNVTGLTLGTITGISKWGWDYLWVRYANFVDSFAYALVKRPIAVYVERVIQPGDFSLLSIGV